MDVFLATMERAAGGMSAQAARLRTTSENIANVDTPGYQRKMLTFEQIALADGGATVAAGPVQLDGAERERIYDPSHPMAGNDGFYTGSNVELMVEIGDSREAQRSYEANLRVMDQARKMASSMLELLRR
ncbi:MAG: flagellar basal body rod protein FlgC [Pseudomonadota bacterium]